jgi:hypothetical protein
VPGVRLGTKLQEASLSQSASKFSLGETVPTYRLTDGKLTKISKLLNMNMHLPVALSLPMASESLAQRGVAHLEISSVDRSSFPSLQTLTLSLPKASPPKPQHTSIICTSMDAPAPPEPTFHLFSALPTELRLAIWRLSLPRRVIEVRTNTEIITPEGQTLPPVRVGYPLCRTPLPSIFRVCREGRGVVLESYRNCQGSAFSAAEYEPGVGSLFDPARDVVYLRPYYGHPPRGFPRRDVAVLPEVGELLSGERLLGRMAIEAEDVRDITALAVGWLEVVAQDVQGLIALLRKFENLEELILVMMEEHDDSWRFGLANRIRHRKGEVTLLERVDVKLSVGCARVVERNIALVTRFRNALMEAQKTAEDGWKPPDVRAMIARRGD